MKRLLKSQTIAILLLVALFSSSVECAPHHPPHKKVTLLTYYGDFIDTTMGMLEDLAIDFIVPAYNYIKSHTALKYMFFTLLIILCVFNVLGNFNHFFKSTKKVKFVANQDIPKDSKQFQKQIKALRETVSYLKQQALKNPVGAAVQQTQGHAHQQVTSQPNANPVQVQLDPQIEQRILKNQQSIDFLKQSLMKIVEIQQDLQKSIVESQREVALDIQGVRTNKPVKKSGGAPHSSQLDSSQQRAPHSHSRQSSTSFLEESNENKLQQIAEQVIQQQQEKNFPLVQQQQLQAVEEYEKSPQNAMKHEEQVHEKPPQFNQQMSHPTLGQPPIATQNSPPPSNIPQNDQQQELPPTMSDPAVSGSAFGRAPPPTRPTPFGARQPPSLMNKKQPVRNVPTGNTPVVIPPRK